MELLRTILGLCVAQNFVKGSDIVLSHDVQVVLSEFFFQEPFRTKNTCFRESSKLADVIKS